MYVAGVFITLAYLSQLFCIALIYLCVYYPACCIVILVIRYWCNGSMAGEYADGD